MVLNLFNHHVVFCPAIISIENYCVLSVYVTLVVYRGFSFLAHQKVNSLVELSMEALFCSLIIYHHCIWMEARKNALSLARARINGGFEGDEHFSWLHTDCLDLIKITKQYRSIILILWWRRWKKKRMWNARIKALGQWAHCGNGDDTHTQR